MCIDGYASGNCKTFEFITIAQILTDAKQRIEGVSYTPSLDAQLLLGQVLSSSRAHIIAHPEKQLTQAQVASFQNLVTRREAGEPIAYILGRRAFYDREFVVTPDVLIPRPETEHLVERAIQLAQGKSDLVAVDCGTGSGAIAVSVAAHRPDMFVYATDIDQGALEVARHNAQMNGVCLHFLQGDLLLPLITQNIRVDLVMANLPYIDCDELDTLSVSHYEPRLALDGGRDGLDLMRRLVGQLPQVCQDNAFVLLEIGAHQAQAVQDIILQKLPRAKIAMIKDYAGFDRIVEMRIESGKS